MAASFIPVHSSMFLDEVDITDTRQTQLLSLQDAVTNYMTEVEPTFVTLVDQTSLWKAANQSTLRPTHPKFGRRYSGFHNGRDSIVLAAGL